MVELEIRKIVIQIEELHREIGQEIDPPARKATAAAVFKNPHAGKYVDDLSAFHDISAQIGGLMARRAVEALGVAPADIQSYGKGAIVGLNGEIEHGAAILHTGLGKPVREAVEKGDDIIPSTKKMGGPGAVIVVPLSNKNDRWCIGNMDSIEISIPDAPRPDEIIFVMAVADSGRPLARIG